MSRVIYLLDELKGPGIQKKYRLSVSGIMACKNRPVKEKLGV